MKAVSRLTLATEQLHQAIGAARRATWEAAQILRVIRNERLWSERYATFGAWQEAESGLHRSTCSRLLAVLELVHGTSPEEAQRIEAIDPLRLYEVRQLISGDYRDQALALAEGPAPLHELRAAVEELRGPQHQPTGWRTVMFRLSEDVYALWQQALCRARFEAHKRAPGWDDMIEYLATLACQEPLAPDCRIPLDEILSGAAACQECGSLDAFDLDAHHVVPRSHGGWGGTVYLCRECHNAVQPVWRAWAEKKGLLKERTGPQGDESTQAEA